MQNRVVANQVSKGERTNRVIHAEFHDTIDGFGLSHSLLKCQNGLVDHRAENPIRHETRGIVAGEGCLAHPLTCFDDGSCHCFGSLAAVDYLDQSHDCDRVHEVHSDDLVGALCSSGDFVYRNR